MLFLHGRLEMGILSLNIFCSPNIITGINRHKELGDHNKRCVNENELEKSSGVEKEILKICIDENKDGREGHKIRNIGGANKL